MVRTNRIASQNHTPHRCARFLATNFTLLESNFDVYSDT